MFNWEYWSFRMVYTWIYPVWLFLALRARSLFFFSAANPSIKYGGFLGESKKDIHDLIPTDLYPPTIHFQKGTDAATIVDALRRQNFEYPLIGKPDMGGRGRGVKVLNSDADTSLYAAACEVDFHIQKFVDFPKEVGIFYHRLPGEHSGRITGIVRKEFLGVTGDGSRSVRELLYENDRAILQLKALEQMHGSLLDEVPEKDKRIVLVPYGNHARGAMFLDDSYLADDKLTKSIDVVCKRIDGFYYGRLDIRYKDLEDLKEAKNFYVIEVNGAGSEPTHIYDPKHSLFFAWKEIIRHWIILWKVSRLNHRRGHPYLTLKEAKQMFREDSENSEKIERMI